ncbi:MAG: hypothetical protein XD63_0753 [Thermoanaerobacterales bacterium 50_218]|nr:MAG: hypothetical protein XD63_0753 [Thermoanaerobacterales bacterium 50_218]HAA90159.1 hypothetical protein [Peptococcaceae bacterium]
MTRIVAGILVVFLVFLLVCEFTLPGFAASSLEKVITASELRPGKVEAEVVVFPAARLLFGGVDQVILNLYDLPLKEGMRISLLQMRFPQSQFQWWKLRESQEMPFKTGGPIAVKVVVSEEDLNGYLQKAGLKGISSPLLDLDADGVRLEGKVNFLGSSLSVQLWGNFRILDDGGVEFFPTDLKVEGKSLPPELVQKLASHLCFCFSPQELPFSFRAKNVHTEEKTLVITGEI